MRIAGNEPYVSPICPSATLRIITLIVCKISTERSGGNECRLLYQHGYDFVHECDSRFTFTAVNRTVFLHLSDLTPGDRGSYTCECSHARGTFTLNLNFTVGGDEEEGTYPVTTLISGCVIIGAAAVIVAGLVLGLVLRKYKNCRDSQKSGPSGLSSCSLDRGDPDDPYALLQQPPCDLYQTISPIHRQHSGKTNTRYNGTIPLRKLELDGKETDQDCSIYEIL